MIRLFTIAWKKLIEGKYTFNPDTAEYSFKGIDLPAEPGLYQVIADHPLYGQRQTLYIGRTQDINRRNARRFGASLKFWRLPQPIEVGVGLVYDNQYNRITDDPTLTDIEAVLIARHTPALNSTGLDGLRPSAHEILVINDGYTNGLLPDCSGLWFTQLDG